MGRDERKKKVERNAILAQATAKRQQEDRRTKFWIYGTGAVLFIALVASMVIVSVVHQRNKAHLVAAANKPIVGLQSFTGLTRNHTSNQVVYPQNPPVGGDHSSQIVNCGVYTHPINKWEAVHSLEHGAVWVTYRPDLPQQQIDALAKEAASHPYELLSPYPGLPSPVVASAWGEQLKVASAQDPRLPVFLQRFLQGPQTPEPGAPCSGGSPG